LVAGDAFAAVKQLHRLGRQAHIELLLHQLVRDGVVMPLDLDVVVDMHPCPLPFRVGVALARQGVHRRAVELLEEGAPAPGQLLEGALIELPEQGADRRVELA
jgi:hypothetical protein